MCVDDKTCCPLYESIQKGKIPYKCKKCALYDKMNKLMFYSKIGLGIAVLVFICITLTIY